MKSGLSHSQLDLARDEVAKVVLEYTRDLPEHSYAASASVVEGAKRRLSKLDYGRITTSHIAQLLATYIQSGHILSAQIVAVEYDATGKPKLKGGTAHGYRVNPQKITDLEALIL